MQASAQLNNLRVSPRKARVVIDAIRNTPNCQIALAQLQMSDKYVAESIYKLLASAIANAGNKFGVNEPHRLQIKEAYVNEGPTIRRFRPRAQGRATRIRKRTSRITIVVTEKD